MKKEEIRIKRDAASQNGKLPELKFYTRWIGMEDGVDINSKLSCIAQFEKNLNYVESVCRKTEELKNIKEDEDKSNILNDVKKASVSKEWLMKHSDIANVDYKNYGDKLKKPRELTENLDKLRKKFDQDDFTRDDLESWKEYIYSYINFGWLQEAKSEVTKMFGKYEKLYKYVSSEKASCSEESFNKFIKKDIDEVWDRIVKAFGDEKKKNELNIVLEHFRLLNELSDELLKAEEEKIPEKVEEIIARLSDIISKAPKIQTQYNLQKKRWDLYVKYLKNNNETKYLSELERNDDFDRFLNLITKSFESLKIYSKDFEKVLVDSLSDEDAGEFTELKRDVGLYKEDHNKLIENISGSSEKGKKFRETISDKLISENLKNWFNDKNFKSAKNYIEKTIEYLREKLKRTDFIREKDNIALNKIEELLKEQDSLKNKLKTANDNKKYVFIRSDSYTCKLYGTSFEFNLFDDEIVDLKDENEKYEGFMSKFFRKIKSMFGFK